MAFNLTMRGQAATILMLCAWQAWLCAGQAESSWLQGTVAERGFGSEDPLGPGACGYGSLALSMWPFGNAAALDPAANPFAQDATMQGCGICLEVQCLEAGGCDTEPQTVLVTDWCDGCGADTIFVASPAYRTIVQDTVGQVNGQFRRVPCDPPSSITVYVDTYRPDSAWKPMTRTYGAVWEVSGLPPPPFDLRISSGGETVVAERAITEAGVSGYFPTGVQIGRAATVGPALPVPAISPAAEQLPPAAPATEAATMTPTPSPASQQLPLISPAIETPSPALSPVPEAPSAAEPPAEEPQGVVTLIEEEAPLPPPAQEPAAAAVEQVQEGIPLLTPETEPAIRPPVGVLAPSQEAAPGAETSTGLPSTATNGAAPTGAFTEAGLYCASCTPCADREDAPLGLSSVPVDYTPQPGLPTLPGGAPPAEGPASAADVVASVGASGTLDTGDCMTMLEILEGIPEAADWLALMRRVGLSGLLSSTRTEVTLIVPVGDALNATINACPLRNETLLSDLLVNAPELTNPLVGYQVLRGLWPLNTLLPGTSIDSSATIDKVNFLQVDVGPGQQLQGIGSIANVLQGDIVACGPAIIHIVDSVLLPFTFDQGAIDAISGTQPQQTATPVESSAMQLPAPGGRKLKL